MKKKCIPRRTYKAEKKRGKKERTLQYALNESTSKFKTRRKEFGIKS